MTHEAQLHAILRTKERLLSYLTSLPTERLQAVQQTPDSQWTNSQMVNEKGCRCLVGIVEDWYLITSRFYGNKKDARQVRLRDIRKTPGKSKPEYDFDYLVILVGLNDAIEFCKETATHLLNPSSQPDI